MNIIEQKNIYALENRVERISKLFTVEIAALGRLRLLLVLGALLLLFVFSGLLLQAVDPQAAVLDIGILSVLLFGLLLAMAAIVCCLWLHELLWQPFRLFRKQFNTQFNQLTSWQQSILYFSVYFLLLYALLKALAIVL